MPTVSRSTKMDSKQVKVLLFRFLKIQAIREKSLELMLKTVKKVNSHKYNMLKKKLEEITHGF